MQLGMGLAGGQVRGGVEGHRAWSMVVYRARGEVEGQPMRAVGRQVGVMGRPTEQPMRLGGREQLGGQGGLMPARQATREWGGGQGGW